MIYLLYSKNCYKCHNVPPLSTTMKKEKIWNPPNTVKEVRRARKWEYHGGGELVQSTLYACLELSQWNLILLMYANSKIK
jgi:hypothetical protein